MIPLYFIGEIFMFVVRCVWIHLKNIWPIVNTVYTSNIDMILLEMFYLTYLDEAKYMWRKENLWIYCLTHKREKLTLRPPDVLVYEWQWGKHVYIDLSDIFTLVGVRSRGFTTLNIVSNKVVKYEKTRFDNRLTFISFVFW